DEFPEMNPSVETRGDDVDSGFVRRNIENDVRIRARKLSQLPCKHRGRGNGRNYQTHAPRRPVTKALNHVHSAPNVAERRTQTRDELLSRRGRGNAARRAREQAYAKP